VSRLEKITQLSVSTAAGFRGPGGTVSESGGGGVRGRHRLTWELVSGALASPRRETNKLPLEPLARILVLGECSEGDLHDLLVWLDGGDTVHARAALTALVHARPCPYCRGLGSTAGGTKVCQFCEGTGVRYLSERQTAKLLGVTRSQYRTKHYDKHQQLLSKLLGLYVTLESRLR